MSRQTPLKGAPLRRAAPRPPESNAPSLLSSNQPSGHNGSETRKQSVPLKENQCYWIPHPAKVYTMVMIKKIEGEKCIVTTVEDKDNKEIELDIYYAFYPINSKQFSDMALMPHINEAAVLRNLEERSKIQDLKPYTYISDVLVSVNPLVAVPEPEKELFKDRSIIDVEPHPFGLAVNVYKQIALPKIDNRYLL